MKFRKFDIILINFPFTDLKESKIRPALVAKSLGNKNYILCQITTKKREFYEYEVPLLRSACEGDIKFDSFIHIDTIFTLHESIIFGKLGSVKDNKVKADIDKSLRNLFSDS